MAYYKEYILKKTPTNNKPPQLNSKVLGKNERRSSHIYIFFFQAFVVGIMHALYFLWNCKFVILGMTCFLPFFLFVFIVCLPP